MSLLSETIQKIPAIDQTFYEKALDQLANQARPAGSLGMLEDASCAPGGNQKNFGCAAAE